MGVPTSEVGYTSAMPRREYHEVHKDMWGQWGGGGYIYVCVCAHAVSETEETHRQKGEQR